MARHKSTPTPVSTPLPSFEESLLGLENIVDAMEHQHLSLEELVSHYEKGSSLLNRCESILKSARTRIELITLQPQTEALQDTESATVRPTEEEDEDDENDIRLF